jgi:hypothetical protein
MRSGNVQQYHLIFTLLGFKIVVDGSQRITVDAQAAAQEEDERQPY